MKKGVPVKMTDREALEYAADALEGYSNDHKAVLDPKERAKDLEVIKTVREIAQEFSG